MRYALASCMVVAAVLTVSAMASADPVVWTGPMITITKADGADGTLGANHDNITDSTHLTRLDTKGLINWVSETSWAPSSSPANTEWAVGDAEDWASLTFREFNDYDGSAYSPGLGYRLVGDNLVLHLISDDIYIDVRFTSWTTGHNDPRGGFSYERSTIPEPGTMLLLGTGALGMIGVIRRRRTRSL